MNEWFTDRWRFSDLLHFATQRALEITLSSHANEEMQNRNFALDKGFSKLKNLSISGFHQISVVLDRIRDHSLEELTVSGAKLSEELFQIFVDRQKKLKKLGDVRTINVDHITLEELFLFGKTVDNELAAILKNQPALRCLRCETIESAAFNELRKMRHLRC